jgi:hypothetical protein
VKSAETIIYEAALDYLRDQDATISNCEWLCELIWLAMGRVESEERKYEEAEFARQVNTPRRARPLKLRFRAEQDDD